MDAASLPTDAAPVPNHSASQQHQTPSKQPLSDHHQNQLSHHKPAANQSPSHQQQQQQQQLPDVSAKPTLEQLVVVPDQSTTAPSPSETQMNHHSNLLNSATETAAPNVVHSDAQRIVTSEHLPTNPDVINSSQVQPPHITPNDIAAQTLKAATEAASAAVKDELAFGPPPTTYHHTNHDELKHAQSQPAPDPNFADMPPIDSATMLNNVINDDTHQIITSAPQPQQTLQPPDASGNMLHAFTEHADPSTLNPTSPAHQIVTASHPAYQHPQQPAQSEPHQPQPSLDPAHAHQQLVNNTPQQHALHADPALVTNQVDRFPQNVIQPPQHIPRSAAPLQVPTRITNPVVSAALNGTLPKKPARMPGTKQCPTCHSTIAAALAKCTKCQHVFREKKEKVKRSGKRGKKNCPKCNFENPSACSSCKQCKYVFRLKLMERYKQMRPRPNAVSAAATAAAAAAAASAAAAHVTSSLPLVQSSNAPAVTTVPLPAGVASYPGHIAPAIAPPHTVAVLPPFSQNQITIHPHTHNVHTPGVSQVHPIPQHPVQHHQPHPQL